MPETAVRPARHHCPSGHGKDAPRAISAPYDFVPLAERVHLPAWGTHVSHDHPFEDGASGEIHYCLITHSPLLVGGRQEKTDADDRPNTEVRPYRLPDGRYAIPGASLKGMLRAVVEIIGFGRMRMVDDMRPGLRDITGPHVQGSYTARVRNRVKTGFLYPRPDGGQEIVPCEMVRLPILALGEALGVDRLFRQGQSVAEKYDIWEKRCRAKGWDPQVLRFELDEKGENAIQLGEGHKEGYPVFTGQISDPEKKNGKKRDFVFYDPKDRSQAIPVPRDVWRDFLHIHGNDKRGAEAGDMSWPGYWRRKFHRGEPVPVFYLLDGDLLRIGLAYMPKLAGDFSIHDTIRHAGEEHLREPGVGRYDLADLLFGAVNGKNQNDALRGRVSLETAVAEGDPRPAAQPDTILNGPKPTYFPNYLQQNTDSSTLRLKGGEKTQYATYLEHGQNPRPRLRGRKRYPARPDEKVGVQALLPEQEKNKKVQVRLHTLPPGSVFHGRIVFHNLKPEELGALLWAMTWGGDEALRHSLGMGKPFGFGQVSLVIDDEKSLLIPNDPAQAVVPLSEARRREFMERFESHMEKACAPWRESPQMQNLLAMADPEAAVGLPAGMDLRHMCLAPKEKINEFVRAKQKALVLGDYHTLTKKHRDELRRRRQEARRKQAEQARKAAEAEEKARRRAEFEALPEHEKARIAFEHGLDGLPEKAPLRKEQFEELLRMVAKYKNAVEAGGDAEAREAAADLIEQVFDRLGWTRPGLKREKRKKQEEKRRRELQEWRRG